MICPRRGSQHDGAGEFCSAVCEELHAANRDIPHYEGRQTVEATQEANARPPVGRVLLDNGPDQLSGAKAWGFRG